MFSLDEPQVVRVEDPAPPAAPESVEEAIEPADESEQLTETTPEPLLDLPGPEFVHEDATLPDAFDEANPLEIRVTTDNGTSPFARTAAHWVGAEGDVADTPAEGRVDDDGRVWLRVDGTDHGLDLGKPSAGLLVTVVLLGLHVLITETATGALLRELQLDPDQDFRPSDPSGAGDKKRGDRKLGSKK